MSMMVGKRALAGIIPALLISSTWSSAQDTQPTFKRYNLRCLAPLLENLDAEAPKTLEEALLAGPAGSTTPRIDDERIGADAVDFPITSEIDGVAAHFNRGIALLHALWYKEAERAFRSVVHLDPDSAMGYWGLAMANELRPGRARVFAKAAVDRTDANSPALERRWVGILGDFYQVSKEPKAGSNANRSAVRIRALEDLVIDHPELVEAKAFMLRQLVLDQYRADVAITSRLGVERLATQLAELAPGHPSRHYGAFLWLGERPDRGIPFAKASTADAIDVAEIWRYAAEALVGAGRSDDALGFFEAAIRVDQRYLSENLLMPWEAENFAGNVEAFIRTLIGMGRIEDAVQWSASLLVCPRESVSFPGKADLDTLGRKLWIEARMRSGQWSLLKTDLESGRLSAAPAAFGDRARNQFWLGVCMLFLEPDATGDATAAGLKELHRQAVTAGVSNEVEQAIISASESLAQLQKLFVERSSSAIDIEPTDPWISPELGLAASGKLGLHADALPSATEALKRHPDHVLAVADYIFHAHQLGKKREAFFRMDRRFRTMAGLADPELPVLERLQAVAEEMQLPDPWTLQQARDGSQMDLNALGPAFWEAPLAPDLSLPDALGQPHSLRRLAEGKPVILNFFLGVECGYCLAQMAVFRPFLDDFRDSGIEFVAISTDPVETLKGRIKLEEGGPKPDDEFPFMVLADPQLEAFRSFGGYDDFEGGPLHLTVLLDGDGHLLWVDRGHAPFKRPAELLTEAQRLLSSKTTGQEAEK